jgi:glycosyltransferase involved in cell wall biosynthesis
MVASLAVALAQLRRARSLFWVMDVYPDLAFALGVLEEGSVPARLLRRASDHALRRADRVVAIGETMGAYLERAAGRPVDVVHNWADGDAIRPIPADGNRLREAWGWTDRFVVLYSGNLGLAHEFDTVIAAAEALRDRPEILIAFVGSRGDDGPPGPIEDLRRPRCGPSRDLRRSR